jgi:hypothetical protein
MIIETYSEDSCFIKILDGKDNKRIYVGYLKPKNYNLLEVLLSLPKPAIGKAWQLLRGKVERIRKEMYYNGDLQR